MDGVSLWLTYSGFYTVAATARTLLTKSVFSIYDFDYPILFSFLTVVTTFCFISGMFATGYSKYSPIPPKHYKTLTYLTLLTAGTMAMQNIAMSLLSVALQQALRGTLPIAVVVLEKIIEGKKHSHWIHLCAVPLVLAPLLTSYGTILASEWNLTGVVCMAGSVVASGAKDVLLHFKIRELKKDVGLINLLFWLQITIGFVLMPWSVYDGQFTDVQNWEHFDDKSLWAFVLFVTLLGGVRAYTQQLVLTLDSALFVVFCNALIQTLSVFISIPAFGNKVNKELWIGSVLSILACAMYAYVRKMEKLAAKKAADAKANGDEEAALTPGDETTAAAPAESTSGSFTTVHISLMLYLVAMFGGAFYLASQ
jgi:drug/metabolite transporter (DMT)-like permease